MADEILEGIKKVFDGNPDLFLSLKNIYNRMKIKGFFRDESPHEAMLVIRIYLESAKFFTNRHPLDGKSSSDGWALKRGFHSLDQKGWDVSNLLVGNLIQRTISSDGYEIKHGAIPLLGDFYRFFFSMDLYQQKQLSIDIRYYGFENDICKIKQDEQDRWFLESRWLANWYKENRVEPGDKIWLVVENIIPLVIRLYTEWERNPDTYRRHRQLQAGKPILSVDTPIRDIIWEYLEKTQKIAHRLDIGKAIIEKRPEISEQSIYACLSANQDLFIKVGEGFWGLKEWGLDQVTRAIRSSKHILEESLNLPTEKVPLDYILVNIASENLVYRILKESPKPLKLAELTDRISKILGVNKDVLARATFFDPSDPRYYRQENGSFTLRENFEEVVHNLVKSELETRTILEKEIRKLDTELESKTLQYTKKIKEIEEERDVLRKLAEEWAERYEVSTNDWDKKTDLLSDFLKELTSYLSEDEIKEIFDTLRKKRYS